MTVNRIFLIGPMGAGKTTIGKQLAQRLGYGFLDSDLELQERTGVNIPTIFDIEGESGFRERERAIIDQLTQAPDMVLATGGGAVLSEENRKHLGSRGMVVYLHCRPRFQYERTRHDRNRPLLQTENPLAKLQALFSERDPLYRQLADIIVTTEKRPASAVIHEIIKKLKPRPEKK
jgi:shikimate kinase